MAPVHGERIEIQARLLNSAVDFDLLDKAFDSTKKKPSEAIYYLRG